MTSHKTSSIFIIAPLLVLANMTFLSFAAFSQDMSKTVFPITQRHFKPKAKPEIWPTPESPTLGPRIGLGFETDYGTGFCLDQDCRLVVTNYHVAVFTRPHKIRGNKVIHRYLATGPDDEGATLNDILLPRPLKYNLLHDLAIFQLREPLRGFHGIPFSLNDLEVGQQVDIYAYPKDDKNNLRLKRKLLRFHGEYRGQTAQGLLAFEYGTSLEGKEIRGGSSGGLIVETETKKVVGILSRAGTGKSGKLAALAVPVESLADFVGKVQPWLVQSIFPCAKKNNISPALADVFPKFDWPHFTSLQHRSEEPPEVKLLREKAQNLADSMRNFVAVETLTWGKGNSDEPLAMADYEVKVLDGFQRFREYPYGMKELEDVPFPPVNTVVVPGGEWSELPRMVGTALGLKIHQFPDMIVNDRPIKVFQYHAEVEDGVPCMFKSVRDFGFYTASKIVTVPCYGEVWTDQDLNILRISIHLKLPGQWKDYRSVVTYGWLRPMDLSKRPIPVTLSTEAEFRNKVYWCHGEFTNYRVFTSESKIVANDYVQSLPP